MTPTSTFRSAVSRSGRRAADRSSRAPSFAALVLLTGVGPLAVDTYIPALPQMRVSLGTSAAVMQLTVTFYIVGLALGQLVAGPLSDGYGRRPFLLGGAAAFTVTSVVCATAVNAHALVAARLVHGLVAGAGVACGRAVISDHYRGEAAATRFGTLSSITQLGPVVAPAVGSVILSVGDWRTVFWALSGLGMVMTLSVVIGIPETLPPPDRHGGGLAATGHRMADLLGDRTFMRHVVVACLATAGFFTYIGGSSFVLQTVYGISEERYAAVFTVNALAMVFGCIVFRFLVARVGAPRLRVAGLALAVAATLGLVIVAAAGTDVIGSLVVPWVLLSCVTAGMGLISPASMALAQEAGQRSRGTAAALQGGGSFLVGALVTPLTGIIGYHSLLPMSVLMVALMTASAVFLLATSGASADRRR